MDQKIIVVVDTDLEELIPDFLNNRQADLDKLKSLVETGDFESVRSIGHSLKGVGGGYGFLKITEIGAGMEVSANEHNMSKIQALVIDLENYLDNIEIQYE